MRQVERHNGLIKRLSFPVFPAHTENFNDSLVYAYLQIMFTIVQTGAFKVPALPPRPGRYPAASRPIDSPWCNSRLTRARCSVFVASA